MAKKTTVGIRFTKDIADIRRTGFVNELSGLILHRLKKKKPPENKNALRMQWFRLPNEPFVFCVTVWGPHEAVDVRAIICEMAEKAAAQQLPVTLDIINQ